MNGKKKIYLIAIYPDLDGGFLARFPDFPELVADYGKDFDDCVLQSSRFLDDVIADKVERGKPLPEPSPVEKVRTMLDPKDGEPLCIVPVTVYPRLKLDESTSPAKETFLPESTTMPDVIISRVPI